MISLYKNKGDIKSRNNYVGIKILKPHNVSLGEGGRDVDVNVEWCVYLENQIEFIPNNQLQKLGDC